MSKINEILTGWGNVIKDQFNMVDPVTKALAKKRLELCNVCDMRQVNMCSPLREGKNIISGQMVKGCGCNISAKTLSPESQCPLSKW
jgi:hypothetical protein